MYFICLTAKVEFQYVYIRILQYCGWKYNITYVLYIANNHSRVSVYLYYCVEVQYKVHTLYG